RTESDQDKAILGGLDVARAAVVPGYVMRIGDFALPDFDAASYFSAADAYGTPGTPADQLASLTPTRQGLGDQSVAQAEGLKLAPYQGPSGPVAGPACKPLREGHPQDLRPGTTVLFNSGSGAATIGLSRYAPTSSVDLGSVQPQSMVSLRI